MAEQAVVDNGFFDKDRIPDVAVIPQPTAAMIDVRRLRENMLAIE